jgi:hypothetical protein
LKPDKVEVTNFSVKMLDACSRGGYRASEECFFNPLFWLVIFGSVFTLVAFAVHFG